MFEKLTAEAAITKLGLKPLPNEGGFYRETYATQGSDRPIGSAILYMVTTSEFSQWHRLDCDELYHFYFGDRLEMGLIEPTGHLNRQVLGPDSGQFQLVIPKGTWQGARTGGGPFGYTLIGATCHPGYQLRGFALPTRSDLQNWMETNVAQADFIKSLQRGIL